MAIVAVLNQKGGSGKTTLAIILAHALQEDGETVLLVDADPQGSARDWHEANGGEVLDVVGLDRETLARDLKVVGEYDWVLIDGAPQIAKLSAVAVESGRSGFDPRPAFALRRVGLRGSGRND